MRFEEMYQADERRGQIFLVLSIIVVIIASLGLFALVSYSVESRLKEIGVRKVMGASVSNIVVLISKEFYCWLLLPEPSACPLLVIIRKVGYRSLPIIFHLGFLIFVGRC